MFYEEVFRPQDIADIEALEEIEQMEHKDETPKKKVKYSYRLSKEKLREFLGFSAEAKLEWLEEANRFINEFLPSEKRKRWEEFIKQQ